MTADFQDRLLDSLMPAKKVEPPIVEDVVPAAGSKARLPACRTQTTAVVKATALNDGASDWRGICAICLDPLPVECDKQCFHSCCCKSICTDCSAKCVQYDKRCPHCRTPLPYSEAEVVRRMQMHADKGNADGQVHLGGAHRLGLLGLAKSPQRAFQLYQLAAAQGHALAQCSLGMCYDCGTGVKMDSNIAAIWYRRAADQGFPEAQCNLGAKFCGGEGVALSYDEAVKWFRLAAAQGHAQALYYLGTCYANGLGVPRDVGEALRLNQRAAAKGHAGAVAQVER